MKKIVLDMLPMLLCIPAISNCFPGTFDKADLCDYCLIMNYSIGFLKFPILIVIFSRGIFTGGGSAPIYGFAAA